jgi:hypothetical protein
VAYRHLGSANWRTCWSTLPATTAEVQATGSTRPEKIKLEARPYEEGIWPIAAENGATPHQLMAIFGWKTLEQAELYTKAVRQQLMAGGAMNLITYVPVSDPALNHKALNS